MKIIKIAQSINRINRINPIYGWILPSGEIVNLPMYEHAEYVKKNPNKFNIKKLDSNMTDMEAYLEAFRAGAIRFSYARKLNLDATKRALSNLFESVHKVYRRAGNMCGVYVNLRHDDGRTMKGVNVDRFDELYEYASSDRVIKVASLAMAGWILPNGEVVDIDIMHSKYILENAEKFGIDSKSLPSHINSFDFADSMLINWLAFEKGAIRYYIGSGNTLAIQGLQSSIDNKIDILHSLYKKYGTNGILMDIVTSKTDQDKKWKYFNSIEDLYSYAGNNKEYRYSSSIRYGWIAPSGEICEIKDMKDHWYYVFNNLSKFNIKSEELNGIDKDDIYWKAFEKGAIRYHSSVDGILNMQCTRKTLRDKVSEIHQLYKRLGCNNGIFMNLVINRDDVNGTDIRIDDIGDLYHYASGVKIYKVSKQMKITLEEKKAIIDLVNRVKKGYHNWVPEDLQLYQNNAQLVEKLLKGEDINWDMYIEDELDKELRELKGML